jgi:hypothetical protein
VALPRTEVESLASLSEIVSAALAAVQGRTGAQTVTGAISAAIEPLVRASAAYRYVTPSEVRQVAYHLAAQQRAGTLGAPPQPVQQEPNRRVRIVYTVDVDGVERRYIAVVPLRPGYGRYDELNAAAMSAAGRFGDLDYELDMSTIDIVDSTELN